MADEVELSEREREILRLVATGASNKQIAVALTISANTVKVHLRNIFAKIGVASRTEATLYAIREGIVAPPVTPVNETRVEGEELVGGEITPSPEIEKPGFRWQSVILVGLLLVLLAAASGILYNRFRPAQQTPVPTPTATQIQSRWEARASMPEGRAGMAAAVYEDAIYVIAGETDQGVTGSVIRYDPDEDKWDSLSAKPVPVTGAGAVTVGGKIYVPGGRLSDGSPTDILEVYDPRDDRWETKASLPLKTSDYSLAGYEGKIYLFGGWDGKSARDAVQVYNPETDQWEYGSPMSSPRSSSAAVVVESRIYVIGGNNGTDTLDLNEAYYPDRDAASEKAWVVLQPLDVGREKMTAVNILDVVLIVGGTLEKNPVEYVPRSNKWIEMDSSSGTSIDAEGAICLLGNQVYAMGGKNDKTFTAATKTYQAVYTVTLPLIP